MVWMVSLSGFVATLFEFELVILMSASNQLLLIGTTATSGNTVLVGSMGSLTRKETTDVTMVWCQTMKGQGAGALNFLTQ